MSEGEFEICLINAQYKFPLWFLYVCIPTVNYWNKLLLLLLIARASTLSLTCKKYLPGKIIALNFDPYYIGMLSKSKGQLVRVTGCLHCLFLMDDINTGESPDEFQIPSVVTDAAVRAAINFVNTCMDHTLYLCGRDEVKEEVSSILSEVTSPTAQPQDDLPVNAASNPGGYMLLIPGKRLHITALNERKKFRDMGNKQGAVETITTLEKDGLGLVITNRTQGTAKVCDIIFTYCSEGRVQELNRVRYNPLYLLTFPYLTLTLLSHVLC